GGEVSWIAQPSHRAGPCHFVTIAAMSGDREYPGASASRGAVGMAGIRDAGVGSLTAVLPPMEYAISFSAIVLRKASRRSRSARRSSTGPLNVVPSTIVPEASIGSGP